MLFLSCHKKCPHLLLSLILVFRKDSVHAHGMVFVHSHKTQIQTQSQRLLKATQKQRANMGFQQGNAEVGLSGITFGTKNKYKRMNSELPEGCDDVLHQEARRNSTWKYVIACAFYASLNNLLLGYGMPYQPSV